MPKRIDHVAIIVRNIEQALVFYRDTLGISPSEIKEVPTEQVRIAFLPMGGPGGSEIELIEPTTPDSSLARFLEKHGEGLHHICLEVEDIDASWQEMQAQGAAVLDKEPRIAAAGRAIFLHPKSTHGVLAVVDPVDACSAKHPALLFRARDQVVVLLGRPQGDIDRVEVRVLLMFGPGEARGDGLPGRLGDVLDVYKAVATAEIGKDHQDEVGIRGAGVKRRARKARGGLDHAATEL